MMTPILYCPSTLREGFETYSLQAAKALFEGQKVSPFLDIEISQFRQSSEMLDAMHRLSISGMQEKFPAVIKDGKIKIASQGERSTHILKPAPWDAILQNCWQLPANEHLTMQIASQAFGIETAANGLCFTPKGHMVYITRRFDINPDGTKLQLEDLASLSQRSEATAGKNFKYTGSYEDIANAIHKYTTAWMVNMERFFKIIVFNYIVGNGDAHLKNFSFIIRPEGVSLSPAYDLLSTQIHIGGEDFALEGGLSPNIEKSDVYLRTGHPCREDFRRFGLLIGLKKVRVDRFLDSVMPLCWKGLHLVSKSYLSQKMQRSYCFIFKERMARFIRK